MIANFSYVERDSPIHRLDPAAKVEIQGLAVLS